MQLLASLYSADLLPFVLIAASVVGAAWINKKGATGEALDYLEKANQLLHKENIDLKKERQEFIAQIESLKAKTDIAQVIRPLAEWQIKHEKTAMERWERTMKALEIIAKAYGADKD